MGMGSAFFFFFPLSLSLPLKLTFFADSAGYSRDPYWYFLPVSQASIPDDILVLAKF